MDAGKGEIRQALLSGLRRTAAGENVPSGLSLREMEAFHDSRTSEMLYGLAIRSMDLPRPREALPLLKRMLKSENGMISIEAASVLALLGDPSGIERLENTRTLTNSQIEFFYAKAALLLLDRPIPKELRSKRSAFRELEASIDKCRNAE